MQKQILDFLTSKGFIVVKFSQGAHAVRGGFIRTRKEDVGVSDIIGCTPDGRFICVEVKKPGGKASSEQIAFLERVEATGGVAILAESLGDVIQKLSFE